MNSDIMKPGMSFTFQYEKEKSPANPSKYKRQTYNSIIVQNNHHKYTAHILLHSHAQGKIHQNIFPLILMQANDIYYTTSCVMYLFHIVQHREIVLLCFTQPIMHCLELF